MPAFSQAQNCKGTQENVDKYTGQKSYNTSYMAPVVLIKYFKDNDTVYFASLNMEAKSAAYAGKGVYIMFENGDKIILENEKVECKYNSFNKYDYSALFSLSASDLLKFTTFPVTEFRLYIHDKNIGKLMGSKMMESFQCLKSK